MDKDGVEGFGKKATGSVKGAVGNVTDRAKTQAEGAAEKTADTAQNRVGGAKGTMPPPSKLDYAH